MTFFQAVKANFIHCSTMIAELLMKYKSKENEEVMENEEPKNTPRLLFCPFAIANSVVIVYYMLHR